RFQEAEAVVLPLGGEVGQDPGEEVAREQGVRGPTGPAVAELIGRAQVRRSVEGFGKHGVTTAFSAGGYGERITPRRGGCPCCSGRGAADPLPRRGKPAGVAEGGLGPASSRRTASPAGQAGRGRGGRLARRRSSRRTASPAGRAGRGRL